jgi:hypothetical protein
MGKTVTATDLLRAGRRDSSSTVPGTKTEQLNDSATSRLHAESSGQLDVEASQPLVAESVQLPEGDQATRWLGVETSKSLVAESSNLAVPTERLGVHSRQTYERATVFLTPDQRKWLKETARGLPVDGLSASDVVRLAVNRLRQDVDEGFALVEVLSAQAYEEAATHPGRRNRGLPPRSTQSATRSLGV